MPRYTEEEIQLLKNSLKYMKYKFDYDEFNFVKIPINYSEITIENFKSEDTYFITGNTRIKIYRLFQLLDRGVVTCSTSFLHGLLFFMFFVEYKNVPLYINEFTEFVAWRLRIGK